jgi:hypothetical protein
MLTHTLIDIETLRIVMGGTHRYLHFNPELSETKGGKECLAALERAWEAINHPIKPKVVCNITGGVLQGASADYPVDIYCLDFDCNEDGYNVVEFEGGKVWLGRTIAEIEPDFVAHVVELAE